MRKTRNSRRGAGWVRILVVLVLGLGLLVGQVASVRAATEGATAFEALRARARAGESKAQVELGWRYHDGQGVAKNYREALTWYRRAAEQGDPVGQYNLGLMYDTGQGVTRDFTEALYWYTKAALQRNPAAQQNLGVLYANGQGVDRNPLYAYVWSALAAEGGQPSAAGNRDRAARSLTEPELLKAKELLAKLKERIDHPETSAPPRSAGQPPSTAPRQSQPSPPPPSRAKGPRVKGTGTGFIITRDGYLLTCHHVIAGGRTIVVKVGKAQYPGRLIRDDQKNDLALLKINGTFEPLAFSGEPSAKMGQEVFTIGYPDPLLQGISAKFTKGEISSLAGLHDDPRLYQISVPVQPGNSGGPLLDLNGNVTGVVEAMLDAKTTFALTGSIPQNVNYAIKGSQALALLHALPGLAAKLPPPATGHPFDQVVEQADRGTVMVVVYD